MRTRKRRRFLLSALSACLLATSPALLAQQPLNLGFERTSVSGEERPWGWGFGYFAFAGQKAAQFTLDDTVAREGSRSLWIALADGVDAPVPQSIQLQVPAGFARGRSLDLSGWLRAAALNGRASLVLEAWGDGVVVAADTGVLAASTDAWQRRDLSIRVPEDATIHSIVVIAVLDGTGTAWFDNLELALDGRRIEALPSPVEPPGTDDLDWLVAHASPLLSAEPDADTRADSRADTRADLARFDEIVGDARIVALGESTHGTREFFTLKHRLLRHLVRERGFTVFAIEANQLAVERLDRFVRFGEGAARQAMRAMFAVWNTEAMLDLVEWLRAHNAAHPDRMVRFVGYDMQDNRGPLDALRAFLAETDPALLPRVESLATAYGAEPSMFTPHVADSVRQRWRREAEELAEELARREAAWLAAAASPTRPGPDSLRVAWAVQSGELLRQVAALNETLNSPDRDRFMADNLDWALATLAPGEKAVVWAHDVHVSRGGDPELSFNAGEQMGAYLARRHGDDYRTFSLLTHEGAYTATRSFQDHTMIEAEAFPAPPGSLEEALHRLPRPDDAVGWIVDLRPAREGGGGAWLRVPRPLRHVGYAAYDYGFELEAVFALEFDGVLFVDRSAASRPLGRE
jgi:erythromycin esterase